VFGVASLLLALQPLRIENAFLYERFMSIPNDGDFHQFREHIEIERTRKHVSPFFFEELSFRHGGLLRLRTFAGLRWRCESGTRFAVGYQFDSVKADGHWEPLHALRTMISFGGAARGLDASLR
jgi:hypothetical protein